MDIYDSFQQFVTTSRSQIPLTMFTINLVFTAVLAMVLRFIYVNYGN